MILAELLKNIDHRCRWMIAQYGSQEAASHHIANDLMLNQWYKEADQKAVALQPRPSPAFAAVSDTWHYTARFSTAVTSLGATT